MTAVATVAATQPSRAAAMIGVVVIGRN